jgi:two-component system, chemotaxis family, chemotaxis protein CheY
MDEQNAIGPTDARQAPPLKRILLVDDSRAVRLAARRVLAAFPLEVLEADNGEAALCVLREQPPVDVVLLDWNMPLMDGMAFLQAVRADEQLSQPQIVMCTTENELHRIIEAIQHGADEYIMKPFTEDIIRDKLQGTGIL